VGEGNPRQHKNGAERSKEKIPGEDDEDRQNPEGAEAAQAFRELILL
jgi:hypothetical protein